jgi:hypothetical protein
MTTTTTDFIYYLANTPGPWTVTGPGPYDTESRVTLTVEQDSPTRQQIALVGNAPATMTREEAEANARLIAAAPELLLELREAERLLNIVASGDTKVIEKIRGRCSKCSEIARDVIIKATGGDA